LVYLWPFGKLHNGHWVNLWPFGKLRGYLEYTYFPIFGKFRVIWYLNFPILVCYANKNLATLLWPWNAFCALCMYIQARQLLKHLSIDDASFRISPVSRTKDFGWKCQDFQPMLILGNILSSQFHWKFYLLHSNLHTFIQSLFWLSSKVILSSKELTLSSKVFCSRDRAIETGSRRAVDNFRDI
jgi:hypothetical protein